MTAGPPWRPHRHQTGDVDVARTKFHREVEQWRAGAEGFRSRGIILSAVSDRWAELTFLMPGPMTTVGACVGIDYVNYDIEAPSVAFLDALTRQPAVPLSRPTQLDGTALRPLLRPHPRWDRPFLCLPGTFEYHTHPQHDGDPWVGARRHNGEGRLDLLTNRLWDACIQDREIVLAPMVAMKRPDVQAAASPNVEAVA